MGCVPFDKIDSVFESDIVVSSMVQLHTSDQPLEEKQFLITVHSFFRTAQWVFIVSSMDAIRELTCALRDQVEASIHEMSLFPLMEDGTPYPYPLREDMRLDRLHEGHRNLVLLIHENPEKAIPRRLLIASDLPQQRPSLNLVEATEEDIPYIWNWVSQGVRKVYLPWSHPRFPVMMKEITDALDGVEFPRMFPYHYYLMGPPQTEEMTLEQRNALLQFYRIIGQHRIFRRIEVYATTGICGNQSEEPMMLTKENMQYVDLVLAHAIEQRER